MKKIFIITSITMGFVFFYSCKTEIMTTDSPEEPFVVEIISPQNNSNLFENVKLEANVTNPSGVVSVEFKINNETDSIIFVPPFNYLKQFQFSQSALAKNFFVKAINTEKFSKSLDIIYFNIIKDRHPTNLNIKQNNQESITLRWNDNSEIETKFYVLFGNNINTIQLLDSTNRDIDSIVISSSNLSPKTYNYFKVIAHNENSFSKYSNIDSIIKQTQPYVKNLLMPSQFNLSENNILELELEAADSNGFSNIMNVYFNVFQPNSITPLKVNMNLKNQIDEDSGMYFYRSTFNINSITGIYRFEFKIIDKDGLESNVVIKEILFVR